MSSINIESISAQFNNDITEIENPTLADALICAGVLDEHFDDAKISYYSNFGWREPTTC